MTPRAVAVLLAVGLAACAAENGSVDPTVALATRPTVSTTTSLPTTTRAATTTAPPSGTGDPGSTAPSAALCARTGTEVLGIVDNEELTEASGLVASRAHGGVLWSHNDGDDARLFALGPDGADLGVFPLDGVDAVDIEDMAIISGVAGDDLLLADIGDNGVTRRSVRIYRFPEPDPAAPGPIVDVEVVDYVYPDGPHNAETLLVDGDRIVIVTKEQELGDDGAPDETGATRPSFLFEGPAALVGDGEPIELTAAGKLDTVRLEGRTGGVVPHPATLVGFGGVPTGGDVAATGDVVVLRTYEAVWAWERRPDQRVVDVFATDPCEVASELERQGEAVAVVGDGVVTVGEGDRARLHGLGR